MQDLSEVTGSKTLVKIAGREYLLEGFTFEDIGALQGECLKQKRKAILETALAMRDIGLSASEYEAEWSRARDQASQVQLTGEDFDKYMRSSGGVAAIFFVLIERQYPGKVTRDEIRKALESKEMTEDMATELFLSLENLQQHSKK